MRCPKCETELKLSDRQAVEIDYCPSCRGVWLDRGELDKIIERASVPAGRNGGSDDDDDDARPLRGRDPRPRGRRSWLGEIFDFGD